MGPLSFVVRGKNFRYLSTDIVATLSSHNGQPLEHLNDEGDAYVLNLVEKTDTEMTFTSTFSQRYTNYQYVGAIATQEREVIWENETQPIP